ncbi:FAD-dependent monooxygenase [Kribbella shirazensis]|uniref:2-polyprenyl-6-methoxyphenol hydroxylase-like FAD-dependent oxidoreductase n=1 Tax=Kribbella shirazensis TaxID=1105143 RepID=A0A7X5ZZG7_9ACTN|nr:FAD-dependent monooxygenase [Kribbella shirazensis]NIK55923.1 2-polyprenyl-6-methoxyphenol hydroxylase-like FAD-dependent oxidoreductase [Kribbella shirazensis]
MSTAIVVGAGIGGVTAAVALQRCGWQVTVLERAPELGEVGAGISVWPSAVAVLEELGVKGVEKASVPSQPAGMRKPDGRWVVSAAQLGVEIPVMIHRAQLHDLITAEFGPAVTVRTGYDVRTVEQDADGVTVNGELRAELLVAADGIRSVVRGALYPQYAGPRYSGFTAYRGIADVDLDDGGGETWGSGRVFGFARLIDGRFYWYGTANQPAGAKSEPTVFESWHDPIPRLIAGSEKILQNDIYDLTLPLVPFVRGRVVLLGDAAHAMTPNLGRGACSAIEDAGALARHLGSAGELAAALTAYDAERRRATTKLVRLSRNLGRIAQTENRVVRTVRDGLFAVGGKLVSLRARK